MSEFIIEFVSTNVPKVGDPATLIDWSDRRPGTVVEVKRVGNRSIVVIQEDHYVLVSGQEWAGTARYEYSRDPDGTTHSFSKEDGNEDWFMSTPFPYRDFDRILIGRRERNLDPAFCWHQIKSVGK